MQRKAFFAVAAAAVLAVPVALAVPPPGKGKPSPTGPNCKPKVSVILKGTLTSDPFEVTQPFASFLIGGGRYKETRVELFTADDNKVFFSASGQDQENLRPVIVDLAKLVAEKDPEMKAAYGF